MQLLASFNILIAGGVWKVQSVAVCLVFLVEQILLCGERLFAMYNKSSLCC